MDLSNLTSLGGTLKNYRDGAWTAVNGGGGLPPVDPLEDRVTGAMLTASGTPTYNPSGWYEFNGTSDFLTLAAPAVADYPFTISAKSNRTSTANFNQTIAGLGDTSVNNKLYGINVNGSNKRIFAQNTTYQYAQGASATTGFATITGVFASNTDKRIYVNGTLVATLTTSVTMAAITALRIGANANASATDKFIGAIDDVRLWDIALDTTQITAVASGDFDVAVANLKHWFTFG